MGLVGYCNHQHRIKHTLDLLLSNHQDLVDFGHLISLASSYTFHVVDVDTILGLVSIYRFFSGISTAIDLININAKVLEFV